MNKKFIITIAIMASGIVLAQDHQAINLSYMDTSVRPQDDFYQYVNGNWLKTVEIPSDRARWGSFDELRENTDVNTLHLLKSSLEQPLSQGSDGQKVADLYRSYIDFDARNARGTEPVSQQLKDIDAVQNLNDLYHYFKKYNAIGGNPFFGGYISAHMKNSNMNTVYLGGGQLGLGRTYYQREDEKNTETLGSYRQYIDRISIAVAGEKETEKGEEIVDFEKKIASKLKTVEEARNAAKRYNPVAVNDLKNLVKNMDVAKYIREVGFTADTVIISELKYYQELDDILNEQNLPVIKAYLKFHVMDGASSYLTEELDRLSFDFYGKILRGQQEQRALEKRGLEFVNANVGELLGKLYVAEYFPKEAKDACDEMVRYLRRSFEQRIQNLAWMSPVTKTKALEKLAKFNVKIGYPDKWKDYSNLQVGTSLMDNVYAVRKWRFAENLAKQGKPVDKTEWGMSPQTVNAYYSPLYNEIVFPAAILQPPFYDYKADVAVNFGGIGAVIGHELSHGFDDSGSQYDGDGNLNNWWTDEDREKFESAANALVVQFEQYEPVPGVFVNGRFTLGENIGDLGGSAVAFDALKMYLSDHGDPGLIDGYTQSQRFFMSWATIWRTKTTDEFVVNQVKTDPHSPAQYRAFGPIINLDAFHEAFDTRPGDKMYLPKEKRIVIW